MAKHLGASCVVPPDPQAHMPPPNRRAEADPLASHPGAGKAAHLPEMEVLGPLLDPHLLWGLGCVPHPPAPPGGTHGPCWLVRMWAGTRGRPQHGAQLRSGLGTARSVQTPHPVPAAALITETAVETPLRSPNTLSREPLAWQEGTWLTERAHPLWSSG